MEYRVEITETLRRTVSVKAESPEEAEAATERRWKYGEIVLTAEDFSEVIFKVQ